MKALILFSCLLFSPLAGGQTLRVAVASNFLSPFKALKKEFQKETDAKILLSSGSTGKLAAQIQQGAPYDIFFSADQKRISFLDKKNLIRQKSRMTYAIGRLALFSTEFNLKKKSLSEALKLKFNHLSIARPKLAPYGLAAREVLQNHSQWKSLKKKIVYGNNISQAHQFVVTGAADAGLVALPQVKSHEKKEDYKKIPVKWHAPIRQEAAILKSSKNTQLAQKLFQFIASKRGQKIIRSFGYKTSKGDKQ